MFPYLTRKRASSTNLQGSQSKSTVSHSRTASKTKNVVDKTLKAKDRAEAIDTTSKIQTRSMAAKKVNDFASVDKGSSKKKNKGQAKKTTKEDVNGKIKAKNSVSSTVRTKGKKDGADKDISGLRQTSLKESFLTQSKRRALRSSDNPEKLKGDSALSKERSSQKKLPVYKHIPHESPRKDADEIYNFEFDVNDSKERLLKKRKKKVLREKNKIFNKIRRKVETNLQSDEIEEVNGFKVEKVERNKEKKKLISAQNEVPAAHRVEHVKEDDLRKNSKGKADTREPEKLENINKEQVESKDAHAPEEPVNTMKEQVQNEDTHASKEPENMSEEQVKTISAAKPTIKIIEDFDNRSVILTNNVQSSSTINFQPFRPTNIFRNEFTENQNSMLNNSLFGKSLSPIMKLPENIQVTSPRQTPQFHTFSQVMNAFQSTPQNRQYDIINRRLTRTLNNSKLHGSLVRAKNVSQKNNENISDEGSRSIINHKKRNTSTPRKFGTEITNINQSLQSNNHEDSINERVLSDIENKQPTIRQSINKINSGVSNAFASGVNEDNSSGVFNDQSLRAALKKEAKEMISRNPKKSTVNVQTEEQKENVDPQPGPSGLQSRSNFNEQRVLRQSNLNNFLNVMDKPEGTIIKTPHRLFEDAVSPPISSNKSVKKNDETNMEIKTAFGFLDNDDDDYDMPSIENKSLNDAGKKQKFVITNKIARSKPFATLSIGEKKDNLLVDILKEDIRKEQVTGDEKLKVKTSPVKERPRNKVNVTDFSDTFDVLSEMDESSMENQNPSDVPLFVDYEPTHFTQPPRHSYRRKRPIRFSFSEESEAEEDEQLGLHHKLKRKKGKRMDKEQEERLMHWVEDINKTFSEIDQHELVIE